MTPIGDLKDGDGKVEAQGEILEVGKTRTTSSGEVATAVMSDGSGQIDLSIWNEDIDLVTKGMTVRIENGFVKSYNGKLQLSRGKWGKMVVVDAPAKPAQEQKPSTGWSTLGHYYGNVKEVREADAKDANLLLKQGWTLEAVKERHVTEPSSEGLRHDSAIIYVLSRRFD